MELSAVILNGNNEAWVRWKADVEIRMAYVSPQVDRDVRSRIMKPQWRGHQRMEEQIDEVALRDYYCTNVIKEVRGLTKDGEPFNPDPDTLKKLWDGNHEFGLFVVEASRRIEYFVQEKKL